MSGLEFEWDPEKATRNEQKHGIAFAQASTVFSDPLSLTIIDPEHSTDEERFVTWGTALDGLLLVVSHTDRGRRIRIISARKATPKERRVFENG